MRLEAVILEHFAVRQGGWVTARSLACEIGYPWRAVARALIRLAERTDLESQEIEWVSQRCRVRKCFAFRRLAAHVADFPSWLVPRAHPVEQTGRIVRMEA